MDSTQPGTLPANQVTPVTLTMTGKRGVEVLNRTGAAEIWFSIAQPGQTNAVQNPGPTTANSYCVPAAVSSYVANLDWGEYEGTATVYLFSTAQQNYLVIGV